MRLNTPAPGSGFTKLASFVIVAAVLSLAKEVFIPIALATLLSFLLAPLVVRLNRWGFGKVFSIVAVVTFAFAVLAVVAWLVLAQALQLADQLPRYQQNVHAKIMAVKKPKPDGIIAKTTAMLKELQNEINSSTPAEETAAPSTTQPAAERPVPVEVKSPAPSPLRLIAELASPVLKPLGTAGAVAFFVVLMLFQREDLRERFLKLVSGGELNVATQAVDDATQRVSRYLLMQLVVNATYGLPIGIGLYFIGVPNAFLWGLLATLLRFIPFVGPWIASIFPILLAFAVDPGWTKPLLTVGLFVVIELISNNVVEPWLYGTSTGVSNIALLMAAIFWTWLWGTPGLLLSTPLTVCLLVLGKYVPGLSFLSVLLGSDPVLEPEARFYQRMLAMDEDELFDLSERFARERSLPELYDAVIIPALALAEQDRHKGTLAEMRQAFIVQTMRDLVETLGETKQTPSPDESDTMPKLKLEQPVLVIPARDEADELAGSMLVQLLERKQVPARLIPAKSLASDWFREIQTQGITTVCVSGVPPFAASAARHTCKRLKQVYPNLRVVVGVWSLKAVPTDLANRLSSSCPESVCTRIAEAVPRIISILEENELAARRPAVAAPETPSEQPHEAAGPEAAAEEAFSSITRQAAKLLNVPVSLISLIDSDPEFWKAHGGLPPDLAHGEALRDTAVCSGGLPTEDLVVLEDVSKDGRCATDPLLQARGIRFYAAVPLKTSDGHIVGVLCATDTEPHEVPERVRQLLRNLGERLIQKVESSKSVLAA